jgi:hypothetical protein
MERIIDDAAGKRSGEKDGERRLFRQDHQNDQFGSELRRLRCVFAVVGFLPGPQRFTAQFRIYEQELTVHDDAIRLLDETDDMFSLYVQECFYKINLIAILL